MNWLKNNWGWIIVAVLGLIPLIKILSIINIGFSGAEGSWITADTMMLPARRAGDMPHEVSGAHMAVKETGEWAIRWLVFVLTLTPFGILTGIKAGLKVRQAAGIIAFLYAAFHFLFFCIDRGLMDTFRDTGYILGLIATVIMLALAITSNRKAMKLMRKNWKRMHRLAYPAAILSIVHVMLLRHGSWMPYAIIRLIGFVLRIPVIKTWIANLKSRIVPSYTLINKRR